MAYTDPEVAWVGLTQDQAKALGIKVKKDLFPWIFAGSAFTTDGAEVRKISQRIAVD